MNADRIEQLRRLFPEAWATGTLDPQKLATALGVESLSPSYGLTWPGKAAARQALDSPPRAAPLPPEGEARSLLLIGDNLEALKLLSPGYTQKIKLIYIDPPYNTGGSFVYPDRYAEPSATYRQRTGLPDEDRGRYHAAWLDMMYPRLHLARRLLRPEGAIAVSIDDHELPTLRLLMDEIFGDACFKNTIIVRRGVKSVQAQFASVDALAVGHEYLVLYANDPATRFRHLRLPLDTARPGSWNNHWRGTERPTMRYELFGIIPARGQWRWSEARSRRAVARYERLLEELGPQPAQAQIDAWWQQACAEAGEALDLLRLSKTGKPEHYVPPSTTKLGSDLWIDLSPRGNADLERLLGHKVFDHPKPVALLRRLVEWLTQPQGGEVVLDFFAGSCASAQAVLEANAADGGDRRFVMVQLPAALERPVSLPAPGGEPLQLHTIADIGRARIRAVLAKLNLPAGEVAVRELTI